MAQSDQSEPFSNASGGIQAQINSLLQILTKLVTATQTIQGVLLQGSGYSPLAWTAAGNLVVATVFPSATAGLIIIEQTVAAALDVTIPASGGPWIVVDGKGVAGANNITVKAAGGRTIRGGASLVMNANWQSYTFYLNGTDYITVAT